MGLLGFTEGQSSMGKRKSSNSTPPCKRIHRAASPLPRRLKYVSFTFGAILLPYVSKFKWVFQTADWSFDKFFSLIFAAYLVRCTLLKQGDEPKEKTFWMVIVRPGVIARGSSLINWKSILNIFSSNWTNCWLQILLAEYFHLVVSSFLDFRIPGSFFPEVWEDSPKIWKLLLEFPVSGSWLKVP